MREEPSPGNLRPIDRRIIDEIGQREIEEFKSDFVGRAASRFDLGVARNRVYLVEKNGQLIIDTDLTLEDFLEYFS